MKTMIEQLFEQAVRSNSPILPVENSCDTLVITGPTRLATVNPDAFVSLAVTALAGYSTKEISQNSIGAPANTTIALSAGQRSVGVLVTVSGNFNTFRRQVEIFTVSATGASNLVIACYPRFQRCQFLVVLVQDNGGVGQVAAGTQPTVAWTIASNPGHVANEFAFSVESINLRDFVSRQG